MIDTLLRNNPSLKAAGYPPLPQDLFGTWQGIDGGGGGGNRGVEGDATGSSAPAGMTRPGDKRTGIFANLFRVWSRPTL